MTISNQHVSIVTGDDYKLADQRALLWTSGDWPNLASCVLTMVVGHTSQDIYGNLPVTWTYTMAASPTPTTTAVFELTGAQTGALAQDVYNYSLSAVLSDGSTVTLALGQLSAQTSPGRLAIIPS